jgi:hypothetical protein
MGTEQKRMKHGRGISMVVRQDMRDFPNSSWAGRAVRLVARWWLQMKCGLRGHYDWDHVSTNYKGNGTEYHIYWCPSCGKHAVYEGNRYQGFRQRWSKR